MYTRKYWGKIFKMPIEKKNLPTKNPIIIKNSLQKLTKSFPGKQTLREFAASTPVLQHILKEIIQTENNDTR